MKKKKIIPIIITTIIIISILIIVLKKPTKEVIIENDYKLSSNAKDKTTIVHTFKEYQDYLNNSSKNLNVMNKDLEEQNFQENSYILYETQMDSCHETLTFKNMEKDQTSYKIYFDAQQRCGVCAPETFVYSFPIAKNQEKKVEIYYKITDSEDCDSNIVYKPIIYIYPEDTMNLTITLENSKVLTHTYPKYQNIWNVKVMPDGNIYDYKTKRNYYGLYWEGLDPTPLNMEEGFVVKKEDTITFLEEKLEILGLNERESNEFIIYWLSQLESSPYNFIRFRTLEEINTYMPIKFSIEPDTFIRILMDFKGLEKPIDVKEQTLTKIERKGFTIVEWGGVKHNEK